ncbi:Uncharacterised protein [Sphingobacterium spiritivorum]|nr:Uncharacterised protein [Sphingobacterium spiritivorum]
MVKIVKLKKNLNICIQLRSFVYNKYYANTLT